MTRQALSSNHYSHDDQVVDVMNYLYSNDRPAYDAIVAEFPEYEHTINEVFRRQASTDSWLDTDAAGVDPEYMMWVTDAIEAKSPVYWEDGEPWVGDSNDED